MNIPQSKLTFNYLHKNNISQIRISFKYNNLAKKVVFTEIYKQKKPIFLQKITPFICQFFTYISKNV